MVPCGAEFSFEAAGERSGTLAAWVERIDQVTGEVLVNGADSTRTTSPFTFAWGDGTAEEGWFPKSHTYIGTSQDYDVRVTAHYGFWRTDSVTVPVTFAYSEAFPIAIPTEVVVSIPSAAMPPSVRQSDLFDDTFFDAVPRQTIEYVLSIAAWIECEFVNDDVRAPDGVFRQVVVRDADFPGMYAVWYGSPPRIGASDWAFQGAPQYSSFFHEIGHNFTLNTPAAARYGEKVDGPARAIYCEALAQIFQHATAYDIINTADAYGLDPGVRRAIWESAVATYSGLSRSAQRYVSRGCPFDSWDDPSPDDDQDVFDTFITIAYVFCHHAEAGACGYRGPVKRMMKLLQALDPEMQDRFCPREDTPDAEAFRATLMVAAVSYGFDSDLRAEFRGYGFPISDEVFDTLIGQAQAAS